MKTPSHWQSENALSTLLTPLSWVYAFSAAMHRKLTSAERAPLPVISVGNLTAGGAGKTPTTLALVPLLQSLGHVPHILTGGYGGDSLHAHRVMAEDDYRRVGDEALLLLRAAPTWVGRNRLASSVAAAGAGASIVVCDDALQHHALHKDVSLLVIDGGFGFGNGKLLPAGPLRERLSQALLRVDAAILIGDDTQHLSTRLPCPVFRARLVPKVDVSDIKNKRVVAFAGLGRPQKFFDTLAGLGATLVATHPFPDHYPYAEHELVALQAQAEKNGATLITTEKDAVKLPASWRERIETLPVALQFETPEAVAEWLKTTLASRAS